MKLYVKFCGGCNPHFDRKSYALAVAEALHAEIVYENPAEADYRLFVSGCGRNCAAAQAALCSVRVDCMEPVEAVAAKLQKMRK